MRKLQYLQKKPPRSLCSHRRMEESRTHQGQDMSIIHQKMFQYITAILNECMCMTRECCAVSAWACCLGAQVAENRSVVASPPNAFGRGGWRWYFGPMTAAAAWICGQPDSDRRGRISALTTNYCGQPEQSSDLLVFSSSPASKPFLRTPAFVPRENNHFREQSSSQTTHSRSTARQSSLQLRLQSAPSKFCQLHPSPSSHVSHLGSTLPLSLPHLSLANIINSMITAASASSLLHPFIVISFLAGNSTQGVSLQSVQPHHHLHRILHIASLSCGIPSQLSHLPSGSPSSSHTSPHHLQASGLYHCKVCISGICLSPPLSTPPSPVRTLRSRLLHEFFVWHFCAHSDHCIKFALPLHYYWLEPAVQTGATSSCPPPSSRTASPVKPAPHSALPGHQPFSLPPKFFSACCTLLIHSIKHFFGTSPSDNLQLQTAFKFHTLVHHQAFDSLSTSVITITPVQHQTFSSQLRALLLNTFIFRQPSPKLSSSSVKLFRLQVDLGKSIIHLHSASMRL